MSFKTISSRVYLLLTLSLTSGIVSPAQGLHGTLVVAVPVNEGLVVCADKRLFNDATGTFDDRFVKVRKVNTNTLFVATNTIGFLDRSTGKMEFDAFEITSNYAKKHDFNGGHLFWDGLRAEIRKQILAYLDKRKFADWPATDTTNDRLLFNLVFYSIGSDCHIRSNSLRVFYEKAQTPVIDIPEVVAEEVRTPQLTGKGKSVMDYLSLHPELVADPTIGRFDESIFDVKKTSPLDAVNFASKLFLLTNTALPGAEVSSTHDCAMLGYQTGFQWIDDLGQPIVR
ncbi:MAG: hypothetical protein ABI878_04465 [Acidobacteriota bacterium]